LCAESVEESSGSRNAAKVQPDALPVELRSPPCDFVVYTI
jgi:hypothetical protein